MDKIINQEQKKKYFFENW